MRRIASSLAASMAGERLEENLGGARVELTAADLREIEQGAAKLTVQGARYPDRSRRSRNKRYGGRAMTRDRRST
jgi:hypothetical protein